MARLLHPSTLVPADLVLVDAKIENGTALKTVRSRVSEVACPICGAEARRVHSRYVRTLADLPLVGRGVRLQFRARRLRCDAALCPRRIFVERLETAPPGRVGQRDWTSWCTTVSASAKLTQAAC